MLRSVWVGLALLFVLVWTSVVVAAPSAADKQTARELVFSGRKKRRRGEVDAALEDLKAAHALMNVPTTGYELGLTQEKAELLVEALDTLLSVGRMPVGKRENRAFKKARKDAKALADEIASRIPTVRLSLMGDDSDGAKVTIDGSTVIAEAVGAPIKLNPGTHTIAATGENGGVAEKTVELSEGSAVEVTLEVAAPEKDEGPVVNVPETTMNPMVYIGFGVGAAGVIVGSITGGLALAKFSEVAPRCPNNQCPPDTHDDIDGGKTLGTVSTVAFVVGGIGIAVGVVGLFLPLDASTDEGAEEAWLVVGPTSLSFGGTF